MSDDVSSSSSMDSEEEKVLADQYRFSGYQLPMIQLDETGPQYVKLPPHPYFSKPQPEWQKPYYQTGGIAEGAHEAPSLTRNAYTDANVSGQQKLWPYLRY